MNHSDFKDFRFRILWPRLHAKLWFYGSGSSLHLELIYPEIIHKVSSSAADEFSQKTGTDIVGLLEEIPF